MKKINLPYMCSFNEAVDILLSYQSKSEDVCADFNGVTLCSTGLTKDEAYLAYYGMTENEFLQSRKLESKKLKKFIKENKKRLKKKEPELDNHKEQTKNLLGNSDVRLESLEKNIEETKEYIFPEKVEEWDNFCNKCINSYAGLFISYLTIILKDLHEGKMFKK